jgi:hypothetical protein
MPQFKKYVWYGVLMGILVACVVGAGVVAAYYAAQNAFMTDRDKALFSGVFSLIAAVFLTGLGIQFLRFKDIQAKYRRKMSEGIQKAKEEVRSWCVTLQHGLQHEAGLPKKRVKSLELGACLFNNQACLLPVAWYIDLCTHCTVEGHVLNRW